MLTKSQAINLRRGDILFHGRLLNKDKTPVRARVNGKCMTLKIDPRFFKLPVKRSLRDCFYILNVNAGDWFTDEQEALNNGKKQIAA